MRDWCGGCRLLYAGPIFAYLKLTALRTENVTYRGERLKTLVYMCKRERVWEREGGRERERERESERGRERESERAKEHS